MSRSRVHTGQLLSSIRGVMASDTRPQARLDRIVKVIAEALHAGVCSIYLRRSDNSLELFATHGLQQEAVHQTCMAQGEGLVGEVVHRERPMNLQQAGANSAFSYHPETGEAKTLSFLGVPILRAGRLLGVLVVQDARQQEFTGEDVEAVQNIAMVLAEIVASGELLTEKELRDVPIRARSQRSFTGKVIVEGLAEGQVVLFEPHIVKGSRLGEDTEAELARLHAGLAELQSSLDRLLLGRGAALGKDTREVMHAFSLFARDKGWHRRLEEAVAAGLRAEAAVERVRTENRQRLLRARDPYLRERLHDLDDLANRLLRHLGGAVGVEALPENAVLIARNIGPAELLEQDSSRLRALVLEEGTRTSHAAIVAGALRLPVVGSVPGVLAAAVEGDAILVDAQAGEVALRPAEETRKSFGERLAVRDQARAEFARLRDLPAITQDGVRVQLMINAGLSVDLPRLAETGADGIGLFRTEFQFMLADHLPRQKDLVPFYKKVLETAHGKPVTFRTLDLGGDKLLPYVSQEREANPALGWRAIRMALDRPGMFRYQLRALIRAAAGRQLRIMFPMVSELGEFRAARALAQAELDRLRRFGHVDLPIRMLTGAMVETPAIAMELPELLAEADFISVGTNDLLQCLFGVDRENPRVSDRYDALMPGSLRLFEQIAKNATTAGKPFSVCGEMASRPEDNAALLALGFREFSVPPSAVGPLKYMIRHLNLAELVGDFSRYRRENRVNLRQYLRKITDHGRKMP